MSDGVSFNRLRLRTWTDLLHLATTTVDSFDAFGGQTRDEFSELEDNLGGFALDFISHALVFEELKDSIARADFGRIWAALQQALPIFRGEYRLARVGFPDRADMPLPRRCGCDKLCPSDGGLAHAAPRAS